MPDDCKGPRIFPQSLAAGLVIFQNLPVTGVGGTEWSQGFWGE